MMLRRVCGYFVSQARSQESGPKLIHLNRLETRLLAPQTDKPTRIREKHEGGTGGKESGGHTQSPR